MHPGLHSQLYTATSAQLEVFAIYKFYLKNEFQEAWDKHRHRPIELFVNSRQGYHLRYTPLTYLQEIRKRHNRILQESAQDNPNPVLKNRARATTWPVSPHPPRTLVDTAFRPVGSRCQLLVFRAAGQPCSKSGVVG